MFYKALGYAVWRITIAYLRQRYARPVKIAAGLGVIALAGYLATRSSTDQTRPK